MLTYDECYKIATNYSESNNVNFDSVTEDEQAYMYDDSQQSYAGKVPFVVSKETGSILGAWEYLNRFDKTFDDFK